MNGRVAKVLRRAAKQIAQGKLERDPRYDQSNCVAGGSVKWNVVRVGKNGHVTVKPQTKVWAINDGKGLNNRGTVRGIYRALKRHYYGRAKVQMTPSNEDIRKMIEAAKQRKK